MGMTYGQYWYGDPQMVRAFYEARKLKRDMENQTAWLNGFYVYQAVSVALANTFRDPKKNEQPEMYPAKPIDFDKPEEEKLDEDVEIALAESWMKQMVRAGKNWGKKK